METTIKYKFKNIEGGLDDGEIKLEFREVDRCKKSDAPLFYVMLSLLKANADGGADFNLDDIAKLDTQFIDKLIVKQDGFNETDFARMKADTIAVYQCNLEIFQHIIAPFLTSNL